MTQEEKTKAYDKALERAKSMIDDLRKGEDILAVSDLESMFPELKESEDERIRKELIKFVKVNIPDEERYIAWLEKQGKVNIASYEIAEKEKQEFVGDGFIKCYADFQDFKEGETYWLEYLGNDNYNVRSDNLLGKTYHITPCQLYTIFKKMTWLEKQGESIKIKKGKNYLCTKTHKYAGVEWIEGVKYYSPEDYSLVNQGCTCYCPKYSKEEHNNFFKEVECDGCLEKQGDFTIRFFTDEFEWSLGRIIAFWNQNHKDGKYDENELMSYIKVRETELVKLFTDNVCKVSLSDCSEEYRKAYYDGYNKCNRDWLKVKDISVDEYNKNAEILLGGQGEQKPADKVEPKFKVGDWITNGATKPAQISSIEDDMYYTHNGTIGGDIESMDKDYHLWTIEDANEGDVLTTYTGRPFIFKGCLDERHPNSPVAYCGVNYDNCFFVSSGISWWTDENVYPATKEQRDLLFSKMKEAGYKWDAEKKEPKKVEQKPAWSEEDENVLQWILSDIQGLRNSSEKSIYIADREINWLKSLKKRVQPQNTWKPSVSRLDAESVNGD